MYKNHFHSTLEWASVFACPTSFPPRSDNRASSTWFRWARHSWSPPTTFLGPLTTTHMDDLLLKTTHSPKSKETKEFWDIKSTVVWGLKSTGWKGRYSVFQLVAWPAQKPSKPFQSTNKEDSLALGMLFHHISVILLGGKSLTLPQLPFLHA